MSLAAFLSILAAALALALIFLAIIARLNGDDQADDTAIIPPADADEPPLGDQVDVRAILHRYSGD